MQVISEPATRGERERETERETERERICTNKSERESVICNEINFEPSSSEHLFSKVKKILKIDFSFSRGH